MIELVWDAGRAGTVRLPDGRMLPVGERTALSPAALVEAAAASSVMAAFMDAAARQEAPVLGFAATAEVIEDAPSGPALRLRSYVMAAEGLDDETLTELAREALDGSVVAQLFGDSVDAEWNLRVLHGAQASGGP